MLAEISARRACRPAVSAVAPTTVAAIRMIITTGPRPGCRNQLATLITSRTPAVATPETANVITRLRMSPPMSDCQMSPATNPISTATHQGMVGFARKLLKPMATNSLRRTATRNAGREYRKKLRNVTTLSSPLYCRRAVTMPMVTPRRIARMRATVTS